MRVHIISDIEGVAGVVRWGQTGGDDPLYHEARRLYTEEINAAVRGAKAAGATEIVVMDCHGAGGDYDFNSLVARPARSRLRVRDPERVDGVHRVSRAGLRRRALRRHARDGRTPDGVMSHTVSGEAWQSLKFNGTLVGETGINAALCGNWGCPVLLVTGDLATCREATALLGDGLTTVQVKAGIGRYSARSLAPVKARGSSRRARSRR